MFVEGFEMTKIFAGHRVDKIFLKADGEDAIRFEIEGNRHNDFWCEGDCCSESWISDLIGVENIIGAVVSHVECKELPDYNCKDGRGRQEEDEVYGFTFKTDKGDFDLIFRNSSNGYYGGWLEFAEYGIDCAWKEITADYPL